MALGLAIPAAAQEVEFNDEFLIRGGAPVELKYFERGSSLSPGSYSVDVYLNQEMVRRADINFSAHPETGEVRPVIQFGLLQSLGVNIPRLMRENLIPANVEQGTPLDIAALIPGASVEF